MSSNRLQTLFEERVNAITHGLGAVLGLLGLFATLASSQLSWIGFAAMLAYTLSVTVLFGVSALYHVAQPGRVKRGLQKADHCAIYALIAGTYTPFALVGLGGWMGWALFVAVWTLAGVGISMELTLSERSERVSLALYLFMGWIGLLVGVPLLQALSSGAVVLIAAGGVLYTGGTWFYARDRPWDHAVWHGFVLGGAASHGLAVLLTV